MARVPGSRTRTRTDTMAEGVSAESYPAVLDSSPPGYVEKISRYFESSVRQSKHDKVPVCNGPAEAESDSGDSLFLTQKSVPEAVRSRRQRHYSLRSTPISPRDLEESSRSEDSPSSSSHEESKTDKGRRRKKYTLPKYHFPFLAKCKHRSTLLPVQNARLHHYVMGGFFNCVRDLWQGYQRPHLEPSVPTVDVDGQDLSEEDEESPEDEDMKVVERKHFVAPSKAKSKQTWCKALKQQRRREAGNARQETSRGRQTAVIPTSSGTETPDRGESSCRVLGQRKRNGEHRNYTARNKTPKRRLTRENQASEEELCNYNDAVCEPQKPQKRHSTQKTTVTEPQTDVSHVEDLFQAGQTGDGPERPSLLHSLSDLLSDTNNDSICNETQVKKRKKKKRRHHESGDGGQGQSREEPGGLHAATSVNMDVEETPSLSGDNRAETPAEQLGFNERNETENESRDDKILSQEERDVPDSKHKRKKRKKNKSSADVRQDVDGSLESDVRTEKSVFSVSCNMEDGSKEKKKKKKKRRSGEDVEHFQSGAVAEPLNDDAEKPKRKKKKRKKEEGLVIPEQCEEEEEEASTRTLDSPPMSTEQFEESGNCLENAVASQETSESNSVKRKKHKKKRQSSFNNDAARDGEEGVDVSFFMDDSVTLAKGSGTSLKKKKKNAIFEGLDVSYTPEENQKNVNNTQKPKEGLEDQNAEMVIKEKKKGRKISEATVAKSDDCVSVQEKDRKRASAFLVADAEKNDARAQGEQNAHVWGAENPVISAGDLEQLHHGVTKKKRKRKMSVEQHSVDLEYPNKTCQSALLELTDTGLKRKKKQRMGNESRSVTPTKSLESTADVGLSPTEGSVVSKKKKRKKKCEDEPCHLIQEGPPTGTEDAEPVTSTLNTCRTVSHKKKGKHGRSAEETPDLVERASASPETLGNQALNDMSDEKKKKKKKSIDKVLLEGRSLTKSNESEPRQNKKKTRNKQSPIPTIIFSSPVISETSLSTLQMSSDNIGKTKQRKVKRRLLNPSEDFLTDC